MLKVEENNLYYVFAQIPLFDNLFLSMQAQNIAIVHEFITEAERNLWMIYMEQDKTPLPEAMFVSAISQMWIFATYELLRTWRQLAKELLEYHKKLQNSSDAEERKVIISSKLSTLSKRRGASSVPLHSSYIEENFRQMADNEEFARKIEVIFLSTEPIFRTIEALRVTLAKHEIPKGGGVYASAPGYSRIRPGGSMQWEVEYKDKTTKYVSRAEIVEDLQKIGNLIK